MDKLDEIFALQAALDAYIGNVRDCGTYTKSDWIQKKSLALIDEVTELLNEVNYKWWKNEKPVDENAVKEDSALFYQHVYRRRYDGGRVAPNLLPKKRRKYCTATRAVV